MVFESNKVKKIKSINHDTKEIDNLTDIIFIANNLSHFHFNIHSIKQHLNEILICLNTLPQTFDTIILTHIWLNIIINFTRNG